MEKILRQKYNEKWQQERVCSLEEGKLGILAKCKKKFAVSSYLESNIFTSYKRAIAKFCVSAHKFPIEVDRYSDIPRESRVCIFGCNTVGDEGHCGLRAAGSRVGAAAAIHSAPMHARSAATS